jgi:hypothetical protein
MCRRVLSCFNDRIHKMAGVLKSGDVSSLGIIRRECCGARRLGLLLFDLIEDIEIDDLLVDLQGTSGIIVTANNHSNTLHNTLHIQNFPVN